MRKIESAAKYLPAGGVDAASLAIQNERGTRRCKELPLKIVADADLVFKSACLCYSCQSTIQCRQERESHLAMHQEYQARELTRKGELGPVTNRLQHLWKDTRSKLLTSMTLCEGSTL